MNVLALDTSTSWESIAICRGPELLAEMHCHCPSSHSSHVMNNLDRLLSSLRMSIADIGLIGVTLGPGSFTGLRIGLTTAKSLAFGLGCPIVGLSSLEALAYNLLPLLSGPTWIIALLDAKRSEVYACSFFWSDGTLEQKTDIVLTSVATLLEELPENVFFCGTGAYAYRDRIQEKVGYDRMMIDQRFLFPQALTIARLAKLRYDRGMIDSAHTLMPLYIRAPDAKKSTTPGRERAEQ
ncbi:tRNA (adenosine(37)-N6)-threonylcarbamoyltransferase complex dimerization subunit type 1 TsaB [bacterium]|nr:tRNA (adenosine(37)-N6)-threonylcarbamoyltransferase complex dimerization subunit type 1 TsaB [bacterium]